VVFCFLGDCYGDCDEFGVFEDVGAYFGVGGVVGGCVEPVFD